MQADLWRLILALLHLKETLLQLSVTMKLVKEELFIVHTMLSSSVKILIQHSMIIKVQMVKFCILWRIAILNLMRIL